MSTPKSRYEIVKNHIVTAIRAGDYVAGDRLPSEHELVRDLKISRMTVNRALRELADEGYVIRRAGLGSFVAPGRMRGKAIDIVSIRDDLAARGRAWSAEVVEQGMIAAPVDIANFMKTEKPLAFLRVVHFGDGEPVELEERWVNPAIAPDFLTEDYRTTTSTDHLLRVAPVLSAEHTVRAVLPLVGDRVALKIDRHSPCLEITRRTWTGAVPASFARLLYPGDRYELTAQFTNAGQQFKV
ncbi:UTRA domain-containing protein [Pseudokordiimonas caeni]|uniref:UTRA domain-containing protein n=1 Tax=Pseudokordiimonas caeni TaxID=2997908 RepID=UPI002812886F|nr:UTRA domain-containing protein [Pseudokordiimonas caeni]